MKVVIPQELVARMCEVRTQMQEQGTTMWECEWTLEDGTVVAMHIDK